MQLNNFVIDIIWFIHLWNGKAAFLEGFSPKNGFESQMGGDIKVDESVNMGSSCSLITPRNKENELKEGHSEFFRISYCTTLYLKQEMHFILEVGPALDRSGRHRGTLSRAFSQTDLLQYRWSPISRLKEISTGNMSLSESYFNHLQLEDFPAYKHLKIKIFQPILAVRTEPSGCWGGHQSSIRVI